LKKNKIIEKKFVIIEKSTNFAASNETLISRCETIEKREDEEVKRNVGRKNGIQKMRK
jgi:hypothetical protein